jgi:hypothetical protein
MHSEKFVCSLKINGMYLRDESGVVKIPFGTDYTLYLKNINSRDAVVKVSIDGKDVLDGNRLVVRGNSSIELLGFMKGQEVKNNFRFIKLTQEIEDRLGYSPEDSLIRIEVWYEKAKPTVQEFTYVHHQPWYPYWNEYPYGVRWISGGGHTTCGNSMPNVVSCYNTSYGDANAAATYTSDVGITVGGKECEQNFGSAYVGDLEDQSHVMVLRLSGYKSNNEKVETVTTTKGTIKCSTCGRENLYKDKFCSNCGTFLVK